MQTRKVGGFLVRELKVKEGLDLLSLLNSDSASFQTELLLRTVSKDNKSIEELGFAELSQHMRDITKAAMELNGFAGIKEEKDVGAEGGAESDNKAA